MFGKTWTIDDAAKLPPDVYGDCDDPDTPRRKIRVRAGLNDARHLDTLLHELLHALDWHKDEAWVRRAASDIAAVLMRAGYARRSK